jgi:hypothetical protein
MDESMTERRWRLAALDPRQLVLLQSVRWMHEGPQHDRASLPDVGPTFPEPAQSSLDEPSPRPFTPEAGTDYWR